MKIKTHAKPSFTRAGTARTFQEFCDWLDISVPKDEKKRKCLLVGAADLASKIDGLATPDRYSLFGVATLLLATKIIVGRKYPLLPEDQIGSCIDAARHFTTEACSKSNHRTTFYSS